MKESKGSGRSMKLQSTLGVGAGKASLAWFVRFAAQGYFVTSSS